MELRLSLKAHQETYVSTRTCSCSLAFPIQFFRCTHRLLSLNVPFPPLLLPLFCAIIFLVIWEKLALIIYKLLPYQASTPLSFLVFLSTIFNRICLPISLLLCHTNRPVCSSCAPQREPDTVDWWMDFVQWYVTRVWALFSQASRLLQVALDLHMLCILPRTSRLRSLLV